MSAYFDHPNISNSDIQKFLQQIGLKREMPANMDLIYNFGTQFHAGILEPHKKQEENLTKDERQLIKAMENTFWADRMCREFAVAKDFHREMEVYAPLTVENMQIQARCKFDGARTALRFGLELKGVKVSSQKQFDECLEALDYDRAAAHYQLTSGYEWTLIIGISKSHPERMFRKIVKRHDDFYACGEHKLIEALKLLHQYSPEDVKLLLAA